MPRALMGAPLHREFPLKDLLDDQQSASGHVHAVEAAQKGIGMRIGLTQGCQILGQGNFCETVGANAYVRVIANNDLTAAVIAFQLLAH